MGNLEARLELAAETLERAGHLTLCVTGTSMLPAIRPGSLVEIRRATADAVSPGDIVLLRAAPGFRLHRLIDIRPGVLITRGDNHRHNDPPEPADRLLGIAVRIEQAA